MSTTLLSDIENRMADFSKSQRYLASYIMEHYEKAAYMTAAKLGATVNVSESTVVRFAIELGFDGYPEMQKALQSYSRNRLTTLQRLDLANDRLGGDNLLKNVLMCFKFFITFKHLLNVNLIAKFLPCNHIGVENMRS